MLILADLSRLDGLVENLVDFVSELNPILSDLIEKKPDLIQNSSYREMAAKYETENRIPNFRPFPVPLMVIGCNFVKPVRKKHMNIQKTEKLKTLLNRFHCQELSEQDRQIVQQFLRHFCLINFAQLYFLNEQSEYSVHRCKLLVHQLAFERDLKEALKLSQMDKSLLVLFGHDKLDSIYANGKPLSWAEMLQSFRGKFAQKKQEIDGLEQEKIDVFAEPDIDYVYKFNLEVSLEVRKMGRFLNFFWLEKWFELERADLCLRDRPGRPISEKYSKKKN